MIIKFDRTPEERYRLSREAFARGELDRALLYGEDAVRGKGSQEYKVSRAEILMAMGRYADAADVALDALCFGVGERAEIYEILARAASELGHFYESLHFFAKRAHFEGDEDTLDAMDEVIEEIDAEQERRRDRDFFVVGKEEERKSADPTLILQANFALDHGDWLGAIRYASEVEKGSEHYVEARTICLRAHLKRREKEVAELIAEEIVSLDEKNGFALYVLIDRFKRKEYIPLLSAMEKRGATSITPSSRRKALRTILLPVASSSGSLRSIDTFPAPISSRRPLPSTGGIKRRARSISAPSFRSIANIRRRSS